MSIAALNEASKLIRDLDEACPHIEGLGVRVSEFLRQYDYVEGVGVHEVGSEVFFDSSCCGKLLHHAKIIASYGTADGRVLYDVALSYNNGSTYAESTPLRDVVPAFIRGIEEATKQGLVPKVFTLDVAEGDSASAVSHVQKNFQKPVCDVPPPGWYCTREAGHEGPCAALPHDASLIPNQ